MHFEPPVHPEQLYTDPAFVRETLDLCECVSVGMFDDPFPYVVPLTFGYAYRGETLRIFLHSRTSPAGQKLRLLDKNDHVALTFYRHLNWSKAPVDGAHHAYRSVMAYGRMTPIQSGTPQQGEALQALLRHYQRGSTQFNPDRLGLLTHFVVECPPDQVFCKSEHAPGSPKDILFLAQCRAQDTATPIDLTSLT